MVVLFNIPIAWHHLRPTMPLEWSDYLAYSHGLVSSLPPANYSHTSMNFIDHTYIGVLPRSTHTTIRRHFSALSNNNNVPTIITFPDQLQLHILWACTGIRPKHSQIFYAHSTVSTRLITWSSIVYSIKRGIKCSLTYFNAYEIFRLSLTPLSSTIHVQDLHDRMRAVSRLLQFPLRVDEISFRQSSTGRSHAH